MSLHAVAMAAVVKEFRRTKGYGERAMEQMEERELCLRLNPSQCSVAAYVRHMAGNMRSRWVDFLGSDGEKPGRDREGEFVEERVSRAEVMAMWESGWAEVFGAMEVLREGDLEKVVMIRREPLSVMEAIVRQEAHYAWHVGQMVLLAKHFVAMHGGAWRYMTIEPGGSGAFNRARGVL